MRDPLCVLSSVSTRNPEPMTDYPSPASDNRMGPTSKKRGLSTSSQLLRKRVRHSNLPGYEIGLAVTVLQRNRTIRIVDDVTFGEIRCLATVEVSSANMKLPRFLSSERNVESAAENPR